MIKSFLKKVVKVTTKVSIATAESTKVLWDSTSDDTRVALKSGAGAALVTLVLFGSGALLVGTLVAAIVFISRKTKKEV